MELLGFSSLQIIGKQLILVVFHDVPLLLSHQATILLDQMDNANLVQVRMHHFGMN